MTAGGEPGGVLLVDKPVGPTSHDVVAIARRALGIRRIGHAGTLDPFASGLLLLCVGSATRLVEYATALDKRYSAVMRLGAATDTDDGTGSVIAASEAWRAVDREALTAALQVEQGTRPQLPPQYSAKKVDGVRSHRIARAGGEAAVAPSVVTVHSIALGRFEPPDVEFDVVCGSGTYIRAIARDVGERLGCHAHLAALRRTAIGGFDVADAITLDALREGGAVERLLPPLAAVRHLPRRDVDAAGARRLALGQALPSDGGADAPAVAVVAGGRLVGIAAAGAGALRPRKMLPYD